MIPLPVLEEIIDRAGVAPRIELLLPAGVRARQLAVRTLLLGMLIVLADHRPAHLTRVHHALAGLPQADQQRLGVLAEWKTGPHLLTYRQTERTFGLAAGALAKDIPDGLPPASPAGICDDLLEASIPDEFKHASTALAVDWTDVETFSRPPSRGASDCADPEASRGHRSGGGPGQDSELFFGYDASAATMMREEHGPAVPELARRMTVYSCRHDPARALVPVLTVTAWNARQADDARRARPAPQDPAPAPQDPHQPGRRSAAITWRNPSRGRHRHTPDHPDHRTQPAAPNNHDAQATSPNPAPAGNTPGTHTMSDPNVKIGAGQT